MNTTKHITVSSNHSFFVLDLALQAAGSAKEVAVHLQILAMAGAIDPSRTNESLEIFDRVRAMTWRLLHPRP